MSKPEIFNNAVAFKDITISGDNPQIKSILDEFVAVEGFSHDGEGAILIAIVKESGDSVNIWTSSTVIMDTMKKIPKVSFPFTATFREMRGAGGNTYYAME